MGKLTLLLLLCSFLNIYTQTIITSVIHTQPMNDTPIIVDTSNGTYIRPKSSSGLSTGAICAIAIPCAALLLGALAAACLVKGAAPTLPAVIPPNLPPPTYVDTSTAHLAVNNPVIQPPPPEIPRPIPKYVEPPVVHPNYPIRQIDPPVVNRAFQPMLPNPNMNVQNMVPVQNVEMVPVQQVEMVPVHEVIPVNQVVQNVVPEAVPYVTPVAPVVPHGVPPIVPNVVPNAIPNVIPGNQVLADNKIIQVPNSTIIENPKVSL